MASKGLVPLATMRGGALARGCGRGGRVVLPLARAAAVSTGLRVPHEQHRARVLHGEDNERAPLLPARHVAHRGHRSCACRCREWLALLGGVTSRLHTKFV